MPTSCADLQRTGHKLSGFFSVKGSKKMEMIYCDFFSNENGMKCVIIILLVNCFRILLFTDKQTWIGYADVKSAPVHFYVQRNESFHNKSTPISFNLAVVNEGNAMDLASGKFTAPQPGIYFFSFAGVARLYSPFIYYFYTSLYLNGNQIGRSTVSGNIRNATDQYSPLAVQSTLNMKKGDQVWVGILYSSSSSSYLYDDIYHYTHFMGFMLEEEIGASL
jgi:hypothetical protein